MAACAEVASVPEEPRTPGVPPEPAVPVPLAPHLTLTPQRFADLPGWLSDHHAEVMGAFLKSCARLKHQPANRMLDNGGAAQDIKAMGLAGRVSDWLPPCSAARKVPAGNNHAARTFFETWFLPFQAGDNTDTRGLFTGYYEAELRGSHRRHGPYRYPLYAPPGDLVSADLGQFRPDWKGQKITGRVNKGRLVPYHTRSEIENGALTGKGRPLLWVDDAIDAFVLHIQGSGRVIMDDGTVTRVGFAGRNGHPYRSIGKALIERGALDRNRASMQAIRAWIEANPEEGARLLDHNPSYIFFRTLRDGEGPIGAQGVALTPRRSLAVDRRFIPYGVPLWLATTRPNSETPLRRLMIAQDTGGAITGPVRGDFFWGYGPEAASLAGRMKQSGRYWLLLPRSLAGWTARQAKPF